MENGWLQEPDEGEEILRMNLPLLAVIVLMCAMIATLSEYLVGALSTLTAALTKQCVGLILIPLAGTFARHDLVEAGRYAVKDRLTDSLALFHSSSFLSRILILLAWPMHPSILSPSVPHTTITRHGILLTDDLVITVNSLLIKGKSDWLSGAILCCTRSSRLCSGSMGAAYATLELHQHFG
ncbi:hypothetical protein B0H10DRAFT_2123942 [Mycena sp. CBHHK59/15]|nr:hypothetical protein B0H10DRAFT_2123942 [Mycena sp. CBHHK59/15]